MSYEVFALKYRPKTFDDVVGQESVAQSLERAVCTERLANAYLFCGSRGVGKTSMARILAKAVNCPNAVDAKPCNACEVCTAIGRGEDIDVIEIDGASNRGIDDVRAIKDGAGFVPSRARYKIYIVDEVHMLTVAAFNALLKVLEEPPPHVRFVFATTDPQNLPETIVSRCQKHEFRRINEADIVKRLGVIAEAEGVSVDDDVLLAIARKAEGGLRDSVGLLDQVVSFAGESVTLQDLESSVGLLPTEHLYRLARAIAVGDAGEVIVALDEAVGAGFGPQDLLADLTSFMRELMIRHTAPDLNRAPGGIDIAAFADSMPLDRVMYVLRLLLNTRGEIRRAGFERIQVELGCVKAARSIDLVPLDRLISAETAESTTEPSAARAVSELPAAPPIAPRPVVDTSTDASADSQPTQMVETDSSSSASASKANVAADGQTSSANIAAEEANVRDADDVIDIPAPPAEAIAVPAVADTTTKASPSVPASANPPKASPTTSIGDAGASRSRSPARPVTLAQLEDAWHHVVDTVRVEDGVVGSVMSKSLPESYDDGRLVISLVEQKGFKDRVAANGPRLVADAVRAVCGADVRVEFSWTESETEEQAAKRRDVYRDPTVRKFIEHFEGSIVNVEQDHG